LGVITLTTSSVIGIPVDIFIVILIILIIIILVIIVRVCRRFIRRNLQTKVLYRIIYLRLARLDTPWDYFLGGNEVFYASSKVCCLRLL
jgi:hypothetical protein